MLRNYLILMAVLVVPGYILFMSSFISTYVLLGFVFDKTQPLNLSLLPLKKYFITAHILWALCMIHILVARLSAKLESL